MGGCYTKTPTNIVDSKHEDSPEDEMKFKKLLLLGAGWSGKSTVFKQMKRHYGKGFDVEERRCLKWAIQHNIVEAMKILCEQNKDGKYFENDSKLKEKYDQILNLPGLDQGSTLDADLTNSIKILWGHKEIQETYKRRRAFFFPNEEVKYFLDNLEDIVKPNYIPSEDDVLRCRFISMGVKREEFDINGIKCELLDVGGQKSERKKWIKCFQNVYIVIFVVAISEYDQVMYEDETENRVVDALNLFEDICNSKWFCNTNVVLYLNKLDLFNQKVAQVKLSKDHFKDFKPPSDDKKYAEEAQAYLIKSFKQKNKQERQIECHCTCATDTDQIRKVFTDSVEKIIIEQNP